MNKAVKDKAKYIVLTKAGTDNSEGHAPVIRWILSVVHKIKTEYWLARVNRMREGQIMDMYYELTRKEKGYAIGLSKGSQRYIED